MTLRDSDYYSERALNERQRIKIAQQAKARQIRRALERQHDAMLGPKPIRTILSIVSPTPIENLS